MPNNPYIAGNPVGKTQAFIGRDDILREVIGVLKNPSQNAIVLYGQRRIGKTSILQYLATNLPKQGAYKPVFFDLQDKAAMSISRVLEELARTIALTYGNSAPDLGDDVETEFRSKWLPGLLQSLGENEKLVLLFDEFDILAEPRGDQAGKAFFPYLRGLLELDLEHLEFVFVLGRRIDDLDSIALSVFKGVSAYRVSLLTRDNTELLARLAERNESLRWTDEALVYLWELTHGHPYLTQQLCSQIWDALYADNPETIPEVTKDRVDESVQKAVDASRNALEWIWNGLPPAERVVISALAEAGSGTISQDRLQEVLHNSGVRVLIRELRDAPELLVEWDLIESDSDADSYTFRVELLRRWLVTNKPLKRVQDELDRLNPVADSLYQAAQGLFSQGSLKEAVGLLRQAVAQNPNHLRANELLAEILITQNEWGEARQLLEHLHEINPVVARPRLAQVLAKQADDIQDDSERLKVYERILELEPRHYSNLREAADKIRFELRSRELATYLIELQQLQGKNRYDEAKMLADKLAKDYPEQQDWEIIRSGISSREFSYYFAELEHLESSKQYDEAKMLANKLAKDYPEQQDWESIQSRISSREFAYRFAELESLQNAKHYEEAKLLAEKLSADFPEQHNWSELLLRLEKLSKISELYQRALGALNSGDTVKARQLFAEVVGLDPEYEKASNYLNIAVRGLDALKLQAESDRTLKKYKSAARTLGFVSIIGVLMLIVWAITGWQYSLKASKFNELSTLAAPVIDAATETERAESTLAAQPLATQVPVITVDSPVKQLDGHDNGFVTTVAISPDGRMLATGSSDQTVILWNISTGDKIFPPLKEHTSNVTSVAFSPDGKVLATGSSDMTVCLWDISSGNLIRTLKLASPITSVAFSPDGKILVTGSNDKAARLWSVLNGTLISTLKGHTDVITSVAFSPNGKILVTGSKDKTARLWDVANGDLIRRLDGHTDVVSSVVFSPDGTLVATGSYDKTARLWYVSDGSLKIKLIGHKGIITTIAFSPDSSRLATGSYDKTVRLVKLANDLVSSFEYTNFISSIAFSPDGKVLVIGSWDQIINVLRID